MMQTATLKDGSVEALPAIVTTVKILETLSPIHLWEIRKRAEDSSHTFFGRTGEDLAKMGLLGPAPAFQMHGSIAAIVRNAVTIEAGSVNIEDPRLAEPEEP